MPNAPARPAARAWIRRTLITVALGYGLICAVMFLAQGFLLFLPTEQTAEQAEVLRARPDVEPLRVSTDGVVLEGVMLRGQGPGPRPTVLYFGGNAEAVGRRVADRGWVREAGWNLVLVSYRGYDQSSGSPSAEALLADGLVVFDAIAQRPDVDPERVVAWGFSLGTGIATHLAWQRPLAGVILAAPYTRLSNIAAEQYPWLPVRALFRHEIDSESWAAEVTEPVLVLHGEQDTLITPAHSEHLAEVWSGPAQRLVLPAAGHNDLGHHAGLRPAVEAFLAERL